MADAAALAEENRRLKQELQRVTRERDAAAQEAHLVQRRPDLRPSPPAAAPSSSAPAPAPRPMPNGHRAGTAAAAARGPAKPAIHGVDVTYEFFSAHERDAALNVQRDIKQSCGLAGDRLTKLRDSLAVLQASETDVVTSSAAAREGVAEAFCGYRLQLSERLEGFQKALQQHREGELNKINKEQEVVRQLLATLDNLVVQARGLMVQPEEEEDTVCGHKSLVEIRAEVAALRQTMLPGDMQHVCDALTAEVTEETTRVRTGAVHEIIVCLTEMLTQAHAKASDTLETLTGFAQDVEGTVPEAVAQIEDEFRGFTAVTREKEQMFVAKVACYEARYRSRIHDEVECVKEAVHDVEACLDSAQRALSSGNDHILLTQLDGLNRALLDADGSTLTLGYDRLLFEPVDNVLCTPLSHLGSLSRATLPYKPLTTPYYHFYQFLEHPDSIYGGSETAPPPAQASLVTAKERTLFEQGFAKIDRCHDGTLSQEELATLWKLTFLSVPRQAIACVTTRIFDEINTAGKDRIFFEDFLR